MVPHVITMGKNFMSDFQYRIPMSRPSNLDHKYILQCSITGKKFKKILTHVWEILTVIFMVPHAITMGKN